jgi:hypothetical protein
MEQKPCEGSVMKRSRNGLVCLIVLLTCTSAAWAQGLPPIPSAPAAPAVPVAPAAPSVPGSMGSSTSQGNIWSKILLTPEQKAACKKHWCESGIAQFVGMMVKPMTLATGGLIKPCCPGPDQAKPEDLAKPSDSADGAAARIKEDEAHAKERRANVRYLGTVDCSRYPEAEKALINALRTDRNECVRWEAAIVLGHGCCCTRKTIEALKMAASASDKDNNPKESSERVRAAAEVSLNACETSADLPPEPPEKAPGAEKIEPPLEEARIRPRIRAIPMADNAIQPAGFVTRPAATTQIIDTPLRVPTGQRGLIDLLRRNLGSAEPPQ